MGKTEGSEGEGSEGEGSEERQPALWWGEKVVQVTGAMATSELWFWAVSHASNYSRWHLRKMDCRMLARLNRRFWQKQINI